jgi:hypothetical protein
MGFGVVSHNHFVGSGFIIKHKPFKALLIVDRDQGLYK